MLEFISSLILKNNPVCVCISHFIYPSINGYLDCLHLLAIANNAAMNVGM